MPNVSHQLSLLKCYTCVYFSVSDFELFYFSVSDFQMFYFSVSDFDLFYFSVSDFEYTPECIVFDLLGIRLYHGWLVDPESAEEVSAIGQCSYNQLVEKIIMNKNSNREELLTEGRGSHWDGQFKFFCIYVYRYKDRVIIIIICLN